jgi:hypothetical protein
VQKLALAETKTFKIKIQQMFVRGFFKKTVTFSGICGRNTVSISVKQEHDKSQRVEVRKKRPSWQQFIQY